MELIIKKLILTTNTNDSLPVDIRYPVGNEKKPAVFILHGFKAWKDWGFFPYISEQIATSGAITITFSFSLNGVPPGSDIYLETEKFANNTVSREIADSEIVLESFLNNELFFKDKLWNGEIYFLGHSRGAAISILLAAKRNVIRKLILWGSISRFGRISSRLKENYNKVGYVEFKDNRTGVNLRMNKVYVDDLNANKENFDLPVIIRGLDLPVLLIHGTQDVTVPVKESLELFENTNKNKAKLVLIENTGHTFGISQPFIETNIALEKVLSNTVEFIKSTYEN